MVRRTLAVGLVFALAASAPRAARAADAQEQQLAQALFDEGRRLMDAHRHAEACPKLAESQRLDPGGGTLLNLALCHEGEGKLATAKVDYDEALAVARADGRKDREQIARERIAAIEPTIPRLTVAVPRAAGADDLEVTVDGLALRRVAWGVAMPVDPGAHVVSAKAPERTAWVATVVLAASEAKTVDVPVGELLAPPSAPAPAFVLGQTSSPAVEAPPRTRPNVAFWATLGVTVAAAGTSVVTGVAALSAKSDATDAGCVIDRDYCPDQAARDDADRARTLAWVSTATLVVAFVGGILTLVLPSRSVVKASATSRGAAGALSVRF